MSLRSILLALCLLPSAALSETIEITAEGPEGPLAGTLETPGQASAVALILPGSGPTDRNGNGPMFRSDAYRMLAEALAEEGIATARIDKRGLAGSHAAGDGNNVSFADYVTDTLAWRDSLLAETGQDCVWLMGHSEGAIIALLTEAEPGICGLVLLTPPALPLSEEIIRQLARFAGEGSEPEIRAGIEAILSGEDINEAELPLIVTQALPPQIRDFARELLGTDPAELVAATTRPLLVLHGSSDIQISLDGLERLQEARIDAAYGLFEGMSHLLKLEEFSADGRPLSYADPSLPLHPALVGTITEFIALQDG